MNLVAFSLKGKGVPAFLRRLGYIGSRFGFTSRAMEHRLGAYVDVLARYHGVPTFPITAVVLERHPSLIKQLQSSGVEFAIHGHTHTDYSRLARTQQEGEIKKAQAVFHSCGIPFRGFRSPYLSGNGETHEVLSQSRFSYVSDLGIAWDVLDSRDYTPPQWDAYQRGLALFRAKLASRCLSLPRWQGGLIDIPMALPDDETLVDRLGLDQEGVARVWLRILDQVHQRGELFTIGLHPERLELCREALEAVLSQAAQRQPPVWLAPLQEIAGWWQKLGRLGYEMEERGERRYHFKIAADEQATVLARGRVTGTTPLPGYGSYHLVPAREFLLESPLRPVIGLSPSASPPLARLLQGMGYLVEVSDNAAAYGIYLRDGAELTPEKEAGIVREIEASPCPLVRFGPWPNGARSALAVSGDIDALSLSDFFLRLWEVR